MKFIWNWKINPDKDILFSWITFSSPQGPPVPPVFPMCCIYTSQSWDLKYYFLSFYRCVLWHCHCWCSCSPLPGLQVWRSATSPKQIWSREEEVGKKIHANLCSMQAWCLEAMGDLIQDTCWGGNRFVLTKEFNLGIIDSDRQICPWPMDLIFQAPYSYLQPSLAEIGIELHCPWQLNLTGGNRHDGKGLLGSSTLVLFPGKLFLLPLEVVC